MNTKLSARSSVRAVVNFIDDPKHAVPIAIGGGVLKGAVVGVLVGQIGIAVLAGVGGGLVAGGVLALRKVQRSRAKKSGEQK